MKVIYIEKTELINTINKGNLIFSRHKDMT